jgi:hypothetical protein
VAAGYVALCFRPATGDLQSHPIVCPTFHSREILRAKKSGHLLNVKYDAAMYLSFRLLNKVERTTRQIYRIPRWKNNVLIRQAFGMDLNDASSLKTVTQRFWFGI